MFTGPAAQHERYAELSRRVMVHVDNILGSPPETRPNAVNGLLRALWELSAPTEQSRNAAEPEGADG